MNEQTYTIEFDLLNSGKYSWPMETAFYCMNGIHKRKYLLLNKVVEPGKNITISLDLDAPNDFGVFKTHWRLVTDLDDVNKQNCFFGPRLYVSVEKSMNSVNSFDSVNMNFEEKGNYLFIYPNNYYQMSFAPNKSKSAILLPFYPT